MLRSRNGIGMTPEWGGGYFLSFVNNLIPFPALDSRLPWTSPAPAPAFSRTWISVLIAARSCLCQELRIQSLVLAVASPSTCEVRGFYAGARAEGPVWKGRRLGDLQIGSIGGGLDSLRSSTYTFRLGTKPEGNDVE